MKSSLCVVWAVIPCMAAALFACGHEDVAETRPTIAPGESREVDSTPTSDLETIHLVDFASGPHLLSLPCADVTLELRSSDGLVESLCCGENSARVLLSEELNYRVTLDRTQAGDCVGPLTFTRLSVGPADDATDALEGTGAGQDAGGADTADDRCDEARQRRTQWFRVEQLRVNAPQGVGILWEGLLNQGFGDADSHLLIRLSQFERDCGGSYFELELAQGAANESDEYNWLSGIFVDTANASISEESNFATISDLEFELATILWNSPTPEYLIPLENVKLTGWIDRVEHDVMMEAVLSGVIFEDRITNLPAIPTGFNGSMQTPRELLGPDRRDVVDPRPGWRFDATILALPVEPADSLD